MLLRSSPLHEAAERWQLLYRKIKTKIIDKENDKL